MAKLATALRSMPADEAATVRASLFSRLGNATAGGQSVAGDVFSPASFVTHWSKLSGRAKAALFPGADYRQSIDDIARISEGMKNAEQFANTSKTALAVKVGGHIAGLVVNPVATILSAATEFGAGSLLASPRFARWVATSSKPNAPAMLAHINRLSAIAAAEPAIAHGALGLQAKLAGMFANDNVAASVAARPGQQKGARQ